MYKQLIFTVCLSGMLCACHNKSIQLSSTKTAFDSVFTFVDSAQIKADSLQSMIGISEGEKGSFLLIDYDGKKVVKFDSTGNYISTIINNQMTQPYGKKFGSPISVLPLSKTILIADNNNRRIYSVDTVKKRIQSTFILAGTHMTPIQMALIKNRIVMSGYNLNGDYFLNLYDTSGYYKRSFLKTASPIQDKRFVISPLNYVSIAALSDTLYAVELMDYTISAFDVEGNLLFQKQYEPDYFKALSKDLLKKATGSFEQIRSDFSKPTKIALVKNKLLVEVDMPASSSPGDNYYNSRDYRIDVFDREGNPLKVGIQAGSRTFLYCSENNHLCYFLTGYSAASKTYTIKRYSVNI